MKPPSTPPVHGRLPFFRHLRLAALLWLLKAATRLFIVSQRRQANRVPGNRKPTLMKSYPPLPNREVRVFIPPTYKPGDPPLPLLIDIHGGGWCIGDPVLDDPDNLILSHDHGFCVVSIPYRLAPNHRFPTAPKDCAAMITAVLADESLPVDRSRVALAGYSAGGNLTLTSLQLLAPEVKSKIKGVAAYYPSVNMVPTLDEKIARQTLAPDGKDMLHIMGPMFNAAYLPVGQNRADPLLSPIFIPRNDLPAKICIIGCEYDLLCVEASDMAEDLAGSEEGEKVPLEEGRVGWTKGGIRWELIKEAIHGFNQQRLSGDQLKVKEEKTKKMHAGVAEWLKKEVFV